MTQKVIVEINSEEGQLFVSTEPLVNLQDKSEEDITLDERIAAEITLMILDAYAEPAEIPEGVTIN